MINQLFILSAGITFAMGVLTLSIWIVNRKDHAYLYFSIVSIFSGFNFLLARPEFNGEYANIFLLSNAIYWSTFPWFVAEYTQSKKNIFILTSIIIFIGGAYLGYLFSLSYWNSLAHLGLVLIVLYCGVLVYKSGYRAKDYMLLFIYSIFSILAIEEIVYSNFYSQIFYRSYLVFNPLDFYGLLFSLVMGTKMVSDINRRYIIEKELVEKESRWRIFLENIQLIVLKVDEEGKVEYVNDYFEMLTGFSVQELRGKKWLNLLIPGEQVMSSKKLSAKNEHKAGSKNRIITKSGDEKWVLWSEIPINSNLGQPKGSFSIGYDITSEELHLNEIKTLKNQLEKEKLALEEKLKNTHIETEKIIGESEAIQYAIKKAQQVAGTATSVLIEGETGVGKELFANLIHNKSSRNDKPFLKINCAAIPSELMESEFFGHEKGAFTGASFQKKGVFELANEGTLFLDEVGEIPLDLQAKLLRVLQNGEFNRTGGTKLLKSDVRIVSATNKNLQKLVNQQRFREDLFYRLNVYPITIPSLRARKEDIPLLVNYFVHHLSKKLNKKFDSLSKYDLEKLTKYHWPGNIRQLENVIERSIINSPEPYLKIETLESSRQIYSEFSTSTLLDMEKQFIQQTLELCEWKINGPEGAAERLDINPNTLRSKMKKLKIERPVL